MNKIIKKLNPAVDRRFLIVISGIIWSFVGLFLCRIAFQWLSGIRPEYAVSLGIAGIILSMLIYYFGFLKLVTRNIDRILLLREKTCIFAFQSIQSYIIVLIMGAMGLVLRHSALPKFYLSVVYIGFGGAMFLSSLRYFRGFIKINEKP
jgi:hypothetical protein